MTKPKTDNESSIVKALAILSRYAEHNHEMGITEVAGKLGLHKSTTGRLIRYLTTCGFLQQNPGNKKYALGNAAYDIGRRTVLSFNNRIISLALPHLRELSLQTGKTTALELLAGHNIFLAYHIEGMGHLRSTFRQNDMVPINVSVGAKSILAHADADFLEICLQRPFARYNENTITSQQHYRELLKEIRTEGVAYDRGELYNEIHAIGAPILLPGKKTDSAIAISGLFSHMTETYLHSLIRPIKETARAIAHSLQE